MIEVAVLQVYYEATKFSELYGWHIVAVFGGENRVQLAEQEAALRGYTRWSVSEFAVVGGE